MEKLYEAQTEKQKLLMLLAQAPAGMKLKQIVMQFGSKPTNYVGKLLSFLKADGDAENPEMGVWRLTSKGFDKATQARPLPDEPIRKVAESGEAITSSVPDTKLETIGIPGAYEKFMDIGKSLGIQEAFLKVLTDHIFSGDATDLNYVWESLEGMYLRPDVERRLFNFWARAINKPIPERLASHVKPEERWTIIGNEIVRDPEGEYTFSQALQALRFNAAPVPSSNDSVAAILLALQPYLTQSTKVNEIEKKGETSALGSAVKALADQKGGGQSLTLGDVMAIVDKLEEARRSAVVPARQSNLDGLEGIANSFIKLKSLFSGKPATSNSLVIQGAVPLEASLKMEDYQRAVEEEKVALESKQETAKSVRTFLERITRAAQEAKE